MSHDPHTCEHCLMYDQVSGGCKEQASSNWGGANIAIHSSLPVLHFDNGRIC